MGLLSPHSRAISHLPRQGVPTRPAEDGWTTPAPTPTCQRSLVRARAVCRHRDERGGDCASRSGAFWCRPFALSMGRLCAGWHSSVYARIQGPVLPLLDRGGVPLDCADCGERG